MSEDAPQFPPPEGEQLSAQPQEVVNDEAVEQLLTQDRANKEAEAQQRLDDSRWSEEKALAIGTATRQAAAEEAVDQPEKDPFHYEDISEHRRVSQEPTLDDLRSRDRPESWRDEKSIENYEENVRRYEGSIKKVEDADEVELQKLLSKGESREDRLQVLKEGLTEAQENLKSRIKEQIPVVKHEARLEADSEVAIRSKTIEALNDNFEAFYELSPDVFSKMPTPEFIAAYKEFKAVEEEIADLSEKLEVMPNSIAWVDKYVEKQIPITSEPYSSRDERSLSQGNSIQGYVDFVEFWLPRDMKGEATSKLEEAFKTDLFERTPREVAESIRAILSEYLDKLRQKFDEAEQHKQEFLQKHGIKAETEESAVESPVPEQVEQSKA